ncbi:hypothetical protein NDU88_004904 [Pleurodeles waltl]|uniref:Uncharacterized protein n=1 Tax=Pleurodeles waltl TaxID=8319 RepID=A0AAV7VIB4_PLEWA|nr:hypothetical protein NDU88_004904 [Pleurodeles waltl]
MRRPAEGKKRAKISLKIPPLSCSRRRDIRSVRMTGMQRMRARACASLQRPKRPLKDALLERCSKDALLVKTKRAYKGIHIVDSKQEHNNAFMTR